MPLIDQSIALPSSTMRSAALREATPASLMNLFRRIPSDMGTTSTDLYIEGAGHHTEMLSMRITGTFPQKANPIRTTSPSAESSR